MKKMTALMLCAAMLLGLAVPVQAAKAQTAWEQAGFLQEPSVLPPAAEEGKLIAAVGEPEKTAQPISTPEEFLAAKSGSWYLEKDLDLSGLELEIVPSGALIIDGQGHKLTGVSAMLYSYQVSYNLTLRNLVVETAASGVSAAALLTAACTQTLTVNNCTFVADLTIPSGKIYGGGIVQNLGAGSTLTNCTYIGTITNAGEASQMGGLAHSSSGIISGCVFSGVICSATEGAKAGGIVYGGSGILRGCRAEGSYEANILNGFGIAYTYSGKIEDCISSMDGADCGIVSYGAVNNCVVTDVTLHGPGINNSGNVTNCVVQNSSCVSGGISGDPNKAQIIQGCLVENCTITADGSVGGIAAEGYMISGCTVKNSTILSPEGMAGGIIATFQSASGVDPAVIYDCTVENTKIEAYEMAGGIAAKGVVTLIDCKVSGGSVTAKGGAVSTRDTIGYAGGILGYTYNQNYSSNSDCAILSCVADTAVSGYSAGGIAGYLSSRYGTAVIQDCHTSDSVTGKYLSGGIVGFFAGTMRECTSDATVKTVLDERETPTSYVVTGGLVGSMSTGTLENSTFSGTVSCTGDTNGNSSYLGGLVGVQFDGNSSDKRTCTVQNSVFEGSVHGTADYMGGILGSSGFRSTSVIAFTILDCEVTQPEGRTTLYLNGDKAFEGVGSNIGGIVGCANGYTGIYRTVINCDLSVGGKPAKAGGLAGGFGNSGGWIFAEHCTINGNLSVTSDATVSVGGFGCGNISVADCWINGNVTVVAPEEVIENEGAENESRYYSSTGTITGTRGRSSGYYESGFAEGYEMTFNGTVVTEPIAEKRDAYTFKTFDEDGCLIAFHIKGGYYDSGYTFPLAGAKVTVGSVSGYTDNAGLVMLRLEESAFQSAATVTVERAGYDNFIDLHAFAVNEEYYATLWKLDPGKIFITGGTIGLTEYVTRDLFGTAKTFILQEDDGAYPVSVNINWNGHEPGQVLLYGETSGKVVTLPVTDSTACANVVFGGESGGFAPDEMIRLYAMTDTEEYGMLNDVRLTSVSVKEVKIGMDVTDLNEQIVSDPEDGDKFFLEGSKVKLNFGDVGKLAGSVTLSDGVLTVTYGGKDGEKKKGDLFTLDDAYQKDEVSVAGSISIPYEKLLNDSKNANWVGQVKVALNTTTGFSDNAADAMKDMIQGVENDAPIHEDIWDFTVAGVPCYVKASVQVYAGSTLKACGNAENLAVSGTLNGGASGSVGGGVGGAVGEDVLQINGKPALEVMAGLYGKVDGNFSVTMEAVPKGKYDLETNFSMKPVVSGEVGGEVLLHVYMLELKETLKLGSFTWDDTGIQWFLAGEEGEIQALALGEKKEDWSLLGRDYAEKLTLLEESDPNVFLPNVIPSAETASSDARFYATTEDLTVADQRNAMKLKVYQGRNANPTVLDNTATSDHSPHADGDYITWIDVAEQSGEDGLESFLEDGRVAVSSYKGYAHSAKTLLTQPKSGVRTYHPVVTTFWNNTTYTTNATVVWLESPLYDGDGELTLMPQTTEIWYSTTDGKTWTEPVMLIAVTGSVDELYANSDGASVSYRVGSTLHTVSIADKTETTQEDRAWYTVHGDYAAWVQGDKIYYQNARGTYSCDYTGVLTQGPIYDGYDVYYVAGNQIWKTGSSGPSLLAQAEGNIRELQYVSRNVIYLADVNGTTNLYRHEPNMGNAILSLRQEDGTVAVTFRNSGTWELLKGEEVLLSNQTEEGVTQSIKDGITTVIVDAALLPAGETLIFKTNTDEQTFVVKAQTPVIRDALVTEDTLQAYIMPYSVCTPSFMLESWETGELVAAWNGTDETVSGLQYQNTYDVSQLEDGYYILSVTCGDQTASVAVSKGDPLAEEPEMEAYPSVTENGETTIRLMDGGKQLSGTVMVLAARYKNGQMKESALGTAVGGEGVWEITLPEKVTAGWKLFLLDNDTKEPLCQPIKVKE